MKPRILVVGSVYTDFFIRADRLPPSGQSTVGERYEYQPGGRGIYAAVTLEELGAECILCARIGGDSHGVRLKAYLENRGTDARFTDVDRQSQTGLVAVIIESDSPPRRVVYPGANRRLTAEHVEDAFTSYPDALLLQHDIPVAAAVSAVSFANRQGLPSVFDATYTPSAAERDFPLERFEELDVFLADEGSMAQFTDIAPADQDKCMRACLALAQRITAKYIVVKMGSRGIFIYDGTYFKIIAPHEAQTVDPAASSEAFAAALTLEYTRSRDIQRACVFADIVSAIVRSRPGTIASIPKLEEVAEYIEKYDLGYKL